MEDAAKPARFSSLSCISIKVQLGNKPYCYLSDMQLQQVSEPESLSQPCGKMGKRHSSNVLYPCFLKPLTSYYENHSTNFGVLNAIATAGRAGTISSLYSNAYMVVAFCIPFLITVRYQDRCGVVQVSFNQPCSKGGLGIARSQMLACETAE